MSHPPTATPRPLVSVAIATYNRAGLLPETIGSVLAQSMTDLEVVVVDDGSTDDTAEVVRTLAEQDPRVRYVHQPNGGISKARNHAADVARGLYTAVHDDDDIMLPWRLEKQLETIRVGDAGAYGSFVNFDDQTGHLVFHHGRVFTHGAVFLTGFAPGHSTWLVRTDLVRALRYDETLRASVDNNLALRMLRSGVHLHHSGVMCVLRRVHGRSVTAADAPNQNRAARMSRELLRRGIPPTDAEALQRQAVADWGVVSGRAHFPEIVSPYLPDHLAGRGVAHTGAGAEESGDVVVEGLDGQPRGRYRCVETMPLAELLELHRGGEDVIVVPHPAGEAAGEPTDWTSQVVQRLVDRHVAGLAERSPGQAVLWSLVAPAEADRLPAPLRAGGSSVLVRGGERRVLALSEPLSVPAALALQGSTSGDGVDVRLRLVGRDLEAGLGAVQQLADRGTA